MKLKALFVNRFSILVVIARDGVYAENLPGAGLASDCGKTGLSFLEISLMLNILLLIYSHVIIINNVFVTDY